MASSDQHNFRPPSPEDRDLFKALTDPAVDVLTLDDTVFIKGDTASTIPSEPEHGAAARALVCVRIAVEDGTLHLTQDASAAVIAVRDAVPDGVISLASTAAAASSKAASEAASTVASGASGAWSFLSSVAERVVRVHPTVDEEKDDKWVMVDEPN